MSFPILEKWPRVLGHHRPEPQVEIETEKKALKKSETLTGSYSLKTQPIAKEKEIEHVISGAFDVIKKTSPRARNIHRLD